MEIRAANLADIDAAEVQARELPEYLVVSRPAFQPRVERVDLLSFQTLKACQDGRVLGHVSSNSESLAHPLLETLPELIRHGWISGFTLDSSYPPGSHVDA